MSKFLKYSIITPSYNQGEFIEENIRSVLNQGYSNFEHIIMDGGSTDNTVSILKKYPHLIWRSEKDNGQTHALNKALSVVTGDIICWLNSDDLLCEGAFQFINDFFINNPNKYCVIGNLIHIDEKGNLLTKNKAALVDYDGLLNKGQCVQQMSTFFRKEVFDKVGFFDQLYNYTMDHEFWIRVSKEFQFYTIDKDLAKFRKYKLSKTGSKEIRFINETIRYKIKHHANLFSFHNLRIILMYFKEPFKRILFLRRFVRKLKGKQSEFWYYR